VKNEITKLGLSAVLFCIFLSCGRDKVNEDLFSKESFKSRMDVRDGRPILFDDLFLGQPKTITFHPDSFLVIEEMEAPRLIKILDLKNNKIQELIPRGRGPGEMLVAWGVKVIDKDIFLFCGQLSKVIILTMTNDRHFVIDDEFYIEEKQSQRLIPMSHDKFVCLSAIGDEKRFSVLTGGGEIIKKFGEYPSFINDNEVKANNDIFLSVIDAKPGGRLFVAVCMKSDLFEIYDLEVGLRRRFQGPLGFKFSVETQSMGGGYMLRPVPHYLTYRTLIAGENEFWAGYIGHKWEPGKVVPLTEQCTKEIFCFDWEGKPLRILSLEYPAIHFDFDWKGNILYALELRENDPVIAAYSLDTSLPDSK